MKIKYGDFSVLRASIMVGRDTVVHILHGIDIQIENHQSTKITTVNTAPKGVLLDSLR